MSAERTPDPTPEIFEVMVDPVRWRTYLLLRGLGPQRARTLADLANTSEATMLRNLELMHEVGFAHPVEDGTGKHSRYLPWRAVAGGLRLSGMETVVDQATMARWMKVWVETQSLFLRDWAEDEQNWPDEWREGVLNYDYYMLLSLDEVVAMAGELHAVTERYAGLSQGRERAGKREPIYVATNVFPITKVARE